MLEQKHDESPAKLGSSFFAFSSREISPNPLFCFLSKNNDHRIKIVDSKLLRKQYFYLHCRKDEPSSSLHGDDFPMRACSMHTNPIQQSRPIAHNIQLQESQSDYIRRATLKNRLWETLSKACTHKVEWKPTEEHLTKSDGEEIL